MLSRFFVTAPTYVTEQKLIDALQGCADCTFLSARSGDEQADWVKLPRSDLDDFKGTDEARFFGGVPFGGD